MHGLPIAEMMSITSKCFMSTEESSDVKGKSKLFRLILMQKHLVFDPEIYGPSVSTKSFTIREEQLRSVNFKGRYTVKTVVLEYETESSRRNRNVASDESESGWQSFFMRRLLPMPKLLRPAPSSHPRTSRSLRWSRPPALAGLHAAHTS